MQTLFQCRFAHHKSQHGMTFPAKDHKYHVSYGALNTCPVQVGLQEGTVGHHSVLCKWSAGRYSGASQSPVQVGLQEGNVEHHRVLCKWVCRKVEWGITVSCASGFAGRYVGASQCPVQVGLQEGTVGHHRVASNAGCCAHKCKTAPSNFLAAVL